MPACGAPRAHTQPHRGWSCPRAAHPGSSEGGTMSRPIILTWATGEPEGERAFLWSARVCGPLPRVGALRGQRPGVRQGPGQVANPLPPRECERSEHRARLARRDGSVRKLTLSFLGRRVFPHSCVWGRGAEGSPQGCFWRMALPLHV